MTAVELASGFVSLSANTQQLGKDVATAFGTAEKQAAVSGSNMGANLVSGITGHLTGLISGAAVGGIAAAFIEIGKNFEEMNNSIIQKTGASGEALKSLEESAKNVGANTTQGFEAAGNAVSQLTVKLGLTGSPLDDLSTKFLNLSRITGTDVTQNINDVVGAFQKWGVASGDQSKNLDLLYAASTKTGVSVDSLASGLQRFGAPLQAMGFTLNQSTALLGQLTKEGANTDQVMTSLRLGLGKFAKAGEDPATAMAALITSIKTAPTQIDAVGKSIAIFGARGGTEMANAIRTGKLSVDDLMGSIANSGTTINDAASKTQTFQQSWALLKNEFSADVEPAASKMFETLTVGMKWLVDTGVPAIKSFGDFLLSNKDTIGILGVVITTVMLPALAVMVTGWASAGSAAVAGAAANLAASYTTVAGWVSMAAAATASGAETAAIWLMLKADAIGGALAMVPSFVGMVAGWAGTAIAATASAVTIAAAWFIALGPVGWVIGAIALIVGAFVLLWDKCAWFRDLWKGLWNDLLNGISIVWNVGIKPIFAMFVTGLQDIGNAATWLYNNAIKPAWDAIGTGIQWTVTSIITPAFELFKAGLKDVETFLGDVVNGITTAWNGVKAAVATPINFVIQTVWNNGLLKAWNAVAGWLPGLHTAAPLQPVAFDGGGATRGTRGVDNIPALLGGDEHVMDRYDVDKLGGQDKVYALRHMLDIGQAFSWVPGTGVQPARTNGLQAFDKGGAPDPLWMTQLAAGHAFAKSMDGLPYTWGNNDCSGYMSKIADKILGGAGNRKWATSSFPGGQPWLPGLGAGMSVGVHDDPGGPGGGHTSGTLSAAPGYGAANVESGGAHGNVMYGKSAAGADASEWNNVRPGRFHLGIGADGAFQAAGTVNDSKGQESFLVSKLRGVFDAILNPIKASLPKPPPALMGWPGLALQGTEDAALSTAGAAIGGLGNALGSVVHGAESAVGAITSVFRDTGGFIPNGLTLVRNETGQPEAVLNWQQLGQVKDMMAAGKSIMDAVKSVGGDTNPADFGKASGGELNPSSSIGEVGAASYSQKMTGVVASAGQTFAQKASDIFATSLFDILTPSTNLPNPQDLAKRYTIVDSAAGTTPNTSANTVTSTASANTTADNAYNKANAAPAVTSGTATTTATTPGSVTATTVAPAADVAPAAPAAAPTIDPTDYVGNIAQAAKDMSLDINAATIAVATAIVESNLKMYANSSVPDSLNFPHDMVGSDGTSVGLFQQQQNGAWGTLADDMDAYKSAGLFYGALNNVSGWQQMDKGAAAQAVQRSAFPDKYDGQMSYAGSLLKDKFDTGGIVKQGLSVVDNQTGSYEHMGILTQDQWDNLATVAQGGGQRVDNSTHYHQGAIVTQDLNGYMKAQKNLNIKRTMGNRGRPSQ